METVNVNVNDDGNKILSLNEELVAKSMSKSPDKKPGQGPDQEEENNTTNLERDDAENYINY